MSEVTLHQAEATTRCMACGDPNIFAVCHHCGRGLCAEHCSNGAEGSSEFRGFDLKKKNLDEEPIHCEECAHRVISLSEALVLVGASVVLFFLVLALPLPTLLWLPLLALFLAVGFAGAWQYVTQRASEKRVKCPVIPAVENERVVETYRFSTGLDPGGVWQAEMLSAEGFARANLRFGPDDAKRVTRYAKRAGRDSQSSIEVDAGFVSAQIIRPLAIDGVNQSEDGAHIGASRVRIAAEQLPYLLGRQASGRAAPTDEAFSEGRSPEAGPTVAPAADVPSRATSVFPWELQYQIRLADGETRLPVQVVPGLAIGSDRRTLEFHVHWSDTSHPLDSNVDRAVCGLGQIVPSHINDFEFRIPMAGLGSVNPIEEAPIVADAPAGDGGGPGYIVRWENTTVVPEQGSHRYSVRFDQPIPTGTRVTGIASVVFQDSIAGFSGMSWFDPMGRPLTTTSGLGSVSVIELEFDFDLDAIPYEANFVQLEKQLDLTPELLSEVRPDHRTAIEISHKLTEGSFYIFDIAESIFTPSDRSAEQNRIWEIRGRYFLNVAPLDFQIKVEGADLRRRIESLSEVSRLAEVTLAGQAVYDSKETLAEFENSLRTVEELTIAALMRVAGQGQPAAISAGERQYAEEVSEDVGGGPGQWAPPVAAPSDTVEIVDVRREYDVSSHMQDVRCSMCGETDQAGAYVLCHHCGRLLCVSRCRVEVTRDHAFIGGPDRVDTRAAHCEDCHKEHHSMLGGLLQGR